MFNWFTESGRISTSSEIDETRWRNANDPPMLSTHGYMGCWPFIFLHPRSHQDIQSVHQPEAEQLAYHPRSAHTIAPRCPLFLFQLLPSGISQSLNTWKLHHTESSGRKLGRPGNDASSVPKANSGRESKAWVMLAIGAWGPVPGKSLAVSVLHPVCHRVWAKVRKILPNKLSLHKC